VQAFLATITACLWGAGNFSMGIASKRHSPRFAVLVGFAVGFAGSLIYLAVVMPEWNSRAVVWGACSGLAQGVGWGILGYAMHIGRVSVVAPVAAAGTSVFVFLAGMVAGDSVGMLSVLGALIVFGSIALLTAESGDEIEAVAGKPGRHHSRTAPLLAVIVAFCFALQSICLNQVSDEESSVVMFGARLAVVLLIGASLLVRPVSVRRDPRYLIPAAIGGAIILIGDIVYLAALREGPLSVAGVIYGANPAVTVVLAALVLREQLRKAQLFGIVLALSGSALLAAG
jgi:drug/metabolite transporter (DMT)-like permease